MSAPIWLASASPRRRQLLEWVGLAVEVHPADVDESLRAGEAPVEFALRLADAKAMGPTERTVLAADTVVHLDGRVLDKPRSREEAVSHLRALSGRWHEVTTGVCVRRGEHDLVWHVTTRVRFRELGDREVAEYVQTGEADDKAGAYGIQGRAGAFVAELAGSWTNVMGLPVESVLPVLAQVEGR